MALTPGQQMVAADFRDARVGAVDAGKGVKTDSDDKIANNFLHQDEDAGVPKISDNGDTVTLQTENIFDRPTTTSVRVNGDITADLANADQIRFAGSTVTASDNIRETINEATGIGESILQTSTTTSTLIFERWIANVNGTVRIVYEFDENVGSPATTQVHVNGVSQGNDSNPANVVTSHTRDITVSVGDVVTIVGSGVRTATVNYMRVQYDQTPVTVGYVSSSYSAPYTTITVDTDISAHLEFFTLTDETLSEYPEQFAQSTSLQLIDTFTLGETATYFMDFMYWGENSLANNYFWEVRQNAVPIDNIDNYGGTMPSRRDITITGTAGDTIEIYGRTASGSSLFDQAYIANVVISTRRPTKVVDYTESGLRTEFELDRVRHFQSRLISTDVTAGTSLTVQAKTKQVWINYLGADGVSYRMVLTEDEPSDTYTDTGAATSAAVWDTATNDLTFTDSSTISTRRVSFYK